MSLNIECDKCGQLLAIPSTVTDNGDGGVTLSILNDPWPAMDEHRTTCPAEA